MKVVCAHQPDFLPYLGFFDRLLKCDVFVLMDDVQLIRRGWHNRNRIKTPQGPMWITVPILRKGRSCQTILESRIDHTRHWRRQILNAIRFNYHKAPHFEAYFSAIETLINQDVEFLVDLNLRLLSFLLEAFQIRVSTVRASELKIQGRSNEYLVNAVIAVGGNAYLSGTGAKDYLDEEYFQRHGITIHWQDFPHPVYPQLHGEFLSNLSCVDFLFNCGPECPRILREAYLASSSRECHV